MHDIKIVEKRCRRDHIADARYESGYAVPTYANPSSGYGKRGIKKISNSIEPEIVASISDFTAIMLEPVH